MLIVATYLSIDNVFVVLENPTTNHQMSKRQIINFLVK